MLVELFGRIAEFDGTVCFVFFQLLLRGLILFILEYSALALNSVNSGINRLLKARIIVFGKSTRGIAIPDIMESLYSWLFCKNFLIHHIEDLYLKELKQFHLIN